MPLSTIQLYHGGQFYWWRKQEYPEKTTDKLYCMMKTHGLIFFLSIFAVFLGRDFFFSQTGTSNFELQNK
jgi:hypothetical protein